MLIVNSLLAILVGVYFFVAPAFISLYYSLDSSFGKNKIPQYAYDSHKNLSPRFAKWANHRLKNKLALQTNPRDVISNEWPLFSAFWYLQASLQIERELLKSKSPKEKLPSHYAKHAIESAIGIITDNNHGYFTEMLWGDDYLTKENVFYRTMLIGGIATHHQLTGERTHLEQLRKQSDALLSEIDSSEFGLLHDFPEEIYPGDVLLGLASIKQADDIFEIERDSVFERAKRGFLNRTDSFTDLPPYATSESAMSWGLTPSLARGSSTALLLHSAPKLWKEVAKDWISKFENFYFLQNWTAVGFREYPKGTPIEKSQQWFWDVDAGPVLAGHGFTASVFGCGASRKNGRLDLAYPIATEMILLSWPLPNGSSLLASSLSDAKHAPLVGEIAILYNLATVSDLAIPQQKLLKIPVIFWILFALLNLTGSAMIFRGVLLFKEGRQTQSISLPKYISIQFLLWIIFIVLSAIFLFREHYFWAFSTLMISRIFPKSKRTFSQQNK